MDLKMLHNIFLWSLLHKRLLKMNNLNPEACITVLNTLVIPTNNFTRLDRLEGPKWLVDDHLLPGGMMILQTRKTRM